MSCEDCKLRQETDSSAYYRWDNARIEIRGCDRHLREVIIALTFWQNASREGKLGLLLHPESWRNIFDCVRESSIKLPTKENFWAAVQELERQFEEIESTPREETAKLFYVQDKRSHVGNSITWWKEDNCGYVCDIREARIFTQVEIDKLDSCKDGNKRAWPKKYIDQRVSQLNHVDMQYCDYEESLKDGQ